MGLFNIFGEQQHRVFNYKPIYFDPEKEALKQKFGKVDQSKEKEGYTPGAYIQGAFRSGNYQKTRGHSNKAQNIIGLVGLLMIVVVLLFIAKFYTLL